MEKYSRKSEVRSEQIVSRGVVSGSDKLSSLMEVLSHPDYRGYGFMGGRLEPWLLSYIMTTLKISICQFGILICVVLRVLILS